MYISYQQSMNLMIVQLYTMLLDAKTISSIRWYVSKMIRNSGTSAPVWINIERLLLTRLLRRTRDNDWDLYIYRCTKVVCICCANNLYKQVDVRTGCLITTRVIPRLHYIEWSVNKFLANVFYVLFYVLGISFHDVGWSGCDLINILWYDTSKFLFIIEF